MASRIPWEPAASLGVIRQRARLLEAIRRFFAERGVMEVETPVLSQAAATDAGIESFVVASEGEARYLHTSPEFPMKRLLAAGSGDIYQMCRVFRRDEVGRYHNPEFSLLEWYRIGWDTWRLAEEVVALIGFTSQAIDGPSTVGVRTASYSEAFIGALGVDPHRATVGELVTLARDSGFGMVGELDRDGWLDLLFSECVAARFPASQLTVISDFPASQAALARVRPGTPPVAERFEVFLGPVELANGFHELADAEEQAMRFQADRRRRQIGGQVIPPSDECLVAALREGLPDCSGVALGIDRLMMWLNGRERIDEVLTFPWARA